MRKEDLRTGMKVRYRDGDIRYVLLGVVHNQVPGVLLEWRDWQMRIANELCYYHTNDFPKHSDPDVSNLDIVRVWKPSDPLWFLYDWNPDTTEWEMVWEEPEPRKMTLKEVCKELGYPVEIVEV